MVGMGRLLSIGAIVALAAGGLAACGSSSSGAASSGSNTKEVIIGAPMALTGAGGAYGGPMANAMTMVVNAINNSGGIKQLGGAKIKLIIMDTQSNPVTAAQDVRELAQDHVSALVGPVLSTEAIAIKPLVESLKIPVFTFATDTRVTANNTNGYVFGTVVLTSESVQEQVQYISQLIDNGTIKNVTKVGILSTSTPPGSTAGPALNAGLTKLGLKTYSISYDPTQAMDFATTVAKFKADGVNMIVGYQLPNDATLFAQALSNQSWRPQAGFFWISSPVFLDSFRKSEGSLVSGWVTTSFCPSLSTNYYTPQTQALASSFQAQYHATMPGTDACAGATGLTLAVDAIAKAKSSDPVAIAAAARTLTFSGPQSSAYPYYMAVGGVQFNANQNNIAVLAPIIQVTPSGGFDTLYPSYVATAKLQLSS